MQRASLALAAIFVALPLCCLLGEGTADPNLTKADQWKEGGSSPKGLTDFTAPKQYRTKDTRCYVYPHRSVVVKTMPGLKQPSRNITVLMNGSLTDVSDLCRSDKQRVVFELTNQIEDFWGLWNDRLLDSADNPRGGKLYIYDLSKSPPMEPMVVDYEGVAEMKRDGVITYNVLGGRTEDIKKCKAAEGLQPGFAIETELDLRTLKTEPTGKTECWESY